MASKRTSLGDVSVNYLQCRDFGHAWKWVNDFAPYRVDRKIVAMTRAITCMRCGSTREDEYSVPSMEKIKSRYTYSEGYRLVGEKRHVRISEVRQEIIIRINRKDW
jgi:hypothetical protein